jgi:hypothetical protein
MRQSWISIFALLFIPIAVRAEDGWPKGYEIAENSVSPDGKYGVLIPSGERDDEDNDKNRNVLVNLRSHARLCVINGAHYFSHQNHAWLSVKWAGDSSRCVVDHGGRFGFGTLTLVELRGAKCEQADLGRHIMKSLNVFIAQQARGEGDTSGYGSASFQFPPGRKIIVRATAQTNPKSLEGVPTWCSQFQGTYDAAAAKWTRSAARKISKDDMELLDSALSSELEPEGTTFATEDERLKHYDDVLNDVYRGVRILLPADRFAAVKKEQIEWLKQLDAGGSSAAKCKLIGVRITELRALLWEP